MDAGKSREELVAAAHDLFEDGSVSCWAEVMDHLNESIESLAREIGRSSAFVLACLVDDYNDLGSLSDLVGETKTEVLDHMIEKTWPRRK